MISIIIPMYNSEKTIKSCLESILSQNYDSYEILVVDGGSIDNSTKIVKTFNNKNVTLLKQKHKGAAEARNVGANYAKGDIILFVDSDVVLNKNVLSLVDEDFQNSMDVVCGIYDKESIDKNTFPSYDSMRKHFELVTLKSDTCEYFATPRGAVRKTAFNKVGGFNETLGSVNEDLEFGWKLMNAGYSLNLDKRIIVKHHGHSFERSMKAFFIRSYSYTRLFIKNKRKKFENAKTSKYAVINTLIGFMIPFGFILNPIIGIALLIIFILMYLKFYIFSIRERGLLFALKCIIASFAVSVSVTSGVLVSIATLPIDKINGIEV